MLKTQYPTDYLKKEEGVNSGVIDLLEGEQHIEQIAEQTWKKRPILKRLKRSDSDSTLKESQDVIREPISIFQEISQEKNQPKKQNLEGLLNELRTSYSNDLKIGVALKTGDCFFDAVAQGLNELKNKDLIINSEKFNTKSLREDCADYVKQHNNQDSWVYKAIIKDADVGGYFIARRNVVYGGVIKDPSTGKNVIEESDTFNKYLEDIENVAVENGPIPIWGRLDIEGKMICEKYKIKIEVIELTEKPVGDTRIIKSEQGEGDNVIRMVNYKQHFVPLLDSIEADITEDVKVSREEVYGMEASRDTSLMEDIGNFDLKENSDSHINQAKPSASGSSKLQYSSGAGSSQHLSPSRLPNTRQDLSSIDNLNLPKNFEVGQAIADGNCFFDSFRQGLEQQLGIAITVEQLRQDCREFAQNNPPEWFINTIANSHDNSGRVRSETHGSYATNILNSNRWGDPEVEGRILCGKYTVTLHVMESNPLQATDNQQEQFLHQLISNTGSISAGEHNRVNYNDNNVIHIINKGTNHFEPILNKARTRSIAQQENKQALSDEHQSNSGNQPIDSSQHHQINPRSSDSTDYDDEVTPEEELINTIKSKDPEERKLEKITKLFERNPELNVNFQNTDRDTPLHIVVRKGESKVVELLIEKGAKVNDDNVKNKRNRTPLDVAKRPDTPNGQEIVSILEAHLNRLANPSGQQASIKEPSSVYNPVEESKAQSQLDVEQNPEQYSNTKLNEQQREKKRPGKQGLHGEIYQLKLLMLFLKRGVDNRYSFRLSTEKKEAKKFDDLFFEIAAKDGKKEYRLLQAKHKDDESKKITFDNLLTESDSDYSLVKYFFSYQDSKKEKLFKNGIIKDVTVCTNIDLDLDDKYELNGVSRTIGEVVQKIGEKDNILDVASETLAKEAVRYRFSDNVALLLKPKLEDYNLTRLARRLAECFLKNNSIQHHQEHDIFKLYHIVLAEEVIDVKAKKFHDKFIKNEDISEDAKKLRKAFAEEIKKQSKETLTLENINTAISDGRRVVDNKQVGLKLSKNFGHGEDKNWPNNAISDNQIKDFLDHLVFAVNQPNEQQLGRIIENDISKEFNFAAKDYVYNEFFVKMLDWLNGKGAEFISYQDGNSLFDEAKQKLSELELTGLTLEYRSKVKKFGVKFNSNAIQEIGLDNFLTSQNSNEQVFNIITQQSTLSAIKVYQVLQDIYQESYIFMQLDSVLHLQDRVIQAFKGSGNLLVIECKTTEKEEDIQRLYDQLSNIIQPSNNKRVVFIAQEGNLLANKFKSAIGNKYQEKIDEKNSLTDLTVESQNKLLSEGKVIFQGQELSIKQLLGLGDVSLVPQAILDKLNLGAQELEMLLNNQNVDIWNNPLQLSHLESAHYKTNTQISSNQLKQALVTADSEDRFIFVGEENEIKQLLPENQKDTLKRFNPIKDPSDNYRFIVLDADQEKEQFKQLCQQVDKADVKKKNDELQPVLHLLKKEGEGWIWKQTYTRDFYVRRSFHPIIVGNNVKDLVEVEPNSPDFIVFSGINEKELLNLLSIGVDKKDNFKKNTVVLLDETAAQEEFKHLSSNPTNKRKSIHWLKINEVEGQKQLQWRNSWGEISRLREKLDKETVNHPIDEASLADNKERIIVLADEPGMGKSTTLARIAEFIQKEKPLLWVMKIDLNRHQQLLSSKSIKTKEEIADLLFRIDPTSEKNPLAQKIFTYQLERPGQVVLLWDGFDEVKPEKQEAILTLFKFLKEEMAATSWITTRLHDQKRLEDSLSVLAYTFEPLNEKKQINFLSRFWAITFKLEEKRTDKSILEDYAKEVIQRFEQSIQTYKEDKDFISIPLRARMLAEIFQEDVKTALKENKSPLELFKLDEKLVISDLYQRFIDRKYDIYLREKTIVDERLDRESQAILMKAYTKDCELLAMKILFNNQEIAPFIGDKKEELSLNTLSRIGLIQGNEEPVNFIHRTFAEYFAAKWLAEHRENSEVKKFLGIQLFKKEFSVVMRRFFDHFLTQDLLLHRAALGGDVPSFKELLNKNLDISETDSLGRTVLHIAAQEGSAKIIWYLLLEADKLVEDQFGKTPLHYAARFGHDEVVNQLLENLIDIDLDDHIFRTPLHLDTEIGTSIFNNVEYTKSNLVKLVNKQDESGNPPLYYATDNEHWNAACNLLLHGADSRILTKENKKKLLLFAADETHGAYYRYHYLRPVVGLLSIQVPEAVKVFNDVYYYPRLLSYFFANGHTKVIDALLGSIQDFGRRKRIANHEDNSVTPLGRITGSTFNDADHLKIIKYLFNQDIHHGIEIDSRAKGAILLVAAEQGNLNTFKYLVEQKIVPVGYSSASHYTAVDVALIENHQLEILKYLWKNYRGSIDDSFNRTPLHVAAFSANLQATHYLCTHGAEIDAKDESGKTPLHYAAQAPNVPISPMKTAELIGYKKIVQYLIEEQGADFNLVDEDGKTALDLAIENEQWAVTDYLIKKNAPARDSSLLTSIKRFFKSPIQDTSALHLAIRSKDTQWIRFLLQQQVDVNRLDQGKTSLHLVAVVDWPDRGKRDEVVEWLLQRGAQYDVLDNNQKTALDLLRENNSAFSSKSIWLLQLIEELFHSQNLMQDLQAKLLCKKDEVKETGPYWAWHPDVYDPGNPMQFVLNARSVKKGTLLHVAADTGDLAALKRLLEFNRQYIQLKFKNERSYARDYQAIDINAKDEQGNTPLHLAAQHGHQEILLLLLADGAIFSAKNNQKRTPKILAKKGKHQETAELLQRIEGLFAVVQQGNQLDIVDDTLKKVSGYARDRDGKTLLHWAAQQGHVETVRILLDYVNSLSQEKKKEAINALDNQGSTPLHDAATDGQIEVMRLLLQRGAQFNIKGKQGQTPLDRLSYSGNSLLKDVDQLFDDIQSNRPDNVIEVLQHLDASRDDLNAVLQARDERGYTLLHWAAREHYSDVLLQLLKKGAVYDAEDGSFKDNDLFQLIKEWMYDGKPLKFSVGEVAKDPDKLAIVKNARDYSGKTPLHANDNYFRLKYLIEQGVDLTLRDQEGNTPLHAAFERGNIAIAKLFLDQSADVKAENNDGKTPLLWAAEKGEFSIIQYFIKKRAYFNVDDLNAADKDGWTLLHKAAEDGELEVVNLLIERGANVIVKNTDDVTLLHYAASEDNEEIVKILLKHVTHNHRDRLYSFINAKTAKGNTSLHVAAQKGHLEVVQLLLDNKANPNIPDNNGKTPLALAQGKLGQDPENENLQAITALLFSVTDEPFSNLNQQIHSNRKQQKAFVHLGKYIESNLPEIEAKAVKQGLYLPSFESRNVKIDGKCAAITRMFSQELFLGQYESFLSNLQTSAELYERIAQGKQISSREEKEIFALSRLINGVEKELTLPASSLPAHLSPIKNYKTLDDLSLYVSRLTDDFAIHLVTSNHVVAIYRTGDTYTYFDSNVAFVSDLKSVDQLMKVVKKGVEYAGYALAEEGFLVEHFDVAQANNALTTQQKEILEKPIQTERHLLSLQDQEFGLIDVNGEKISRVTLYDMGAKLHVEGSAPVLINSEMSSEDLVENLNSGKIKITAREYLQSLKGNKKEVVQSLVEKMSSLPFDGSTNEIKDAQTIQDLVLSNDGQKLDSYQLNKILKGPIEQSIKALPYYMEVANTKHWPNRLTNAAGRISMAKGFYDIAHSIRYGDTQGFVLGSGEIGFSLFSQLIEDGVVKVAPQVIKQMKHGIFLTRGFAGLISSPFDIYDLVSSSIDLANSKKGTKEWRDSIAGVAFSGTSVTTGVAFTALGKSGVGTVVGLGILIGQGFYSGTSMVIEYKKYKLTTNQEFRLFWYTFALQLPPEDVQYLSARKDVVNGLAQQAWEFLQNNTHVTAYGMGLGEIRFVDRVKRSIPGSMHKQGDMYMAKHSDFDKMIQGLIAKPKEVKVEPSSSTIGMSNPSNESNGRNLSRIVPVAPSPDAEMLCLPQFTYRDYEYDNSFGEKPMYSNSSTAIYHCSNAIIVGRKNDTIENPTMVFDLSLVNGNGLIVSSDRYRNQFNIAQGGTKIYGSNYTSNTFALTDDNFFGTVIGGTANATNVLDVSQLKSKGLSYENNIVTTQEAQMTAENIDHFIGRKAKAEHVDCQNMNNKIVIDSRGGNSGNSDVVSNCRKVIVTGNTKVVSNESDNIFYIKPSSGRAEIEGAGKGFAIFSDTALLQRASNISYSTTNNTLSIEIQGRNNGTFTLDVHNYLDEENNHNYVLIDKYGSVVEPIIQPNSTEFTHFNFKAETNLTTRAEIAERYKEISQVNGNYTVYGVVRDSEGNNMIFGSKGSDVIPLTQSVTFAQGNEKSDVYTLMPEEKVNVTINNYDDKKALDILYLPTNVTEVEKVEDDLHIFTGNATINVENYFRNSSYQHLTVIDKDKNTFLPWPSKQSYVQLVPFFHATKDQYIFLLSKEKVQNNPEIIVNAKLEDIKFYRNGNDLMLTDDKPLIVKLESFYDNKYGNFTLNFRSKDKLSSKQLLELAKIAINYQDEIRSSYYDSFREYRTSTFNSTIHHNQRFVNGSLTTVEPDDKRVGILLLKDSADIKVSADNNDLVFFAAQSNATFVIKNWNDTDHRISMLKFGQAIEVRKLDQFDLSQVSEIQAVINKAAMSNALNEQLEKLNGEIVNGLKYLFASNGIVNGIDTYSCLGFDSIEDQQEFVAAYSTFYSKEKLEQILQDSQVAEALRWLIAKGHTNVSLKDPDKEKEVLLKDLDQCFGAKDNFRVENRNKVSVLKFNQTIEVDLSEVSEIQRLISKYDITQLEELGDDEEFKYLLVNIDIENGIDIYSCVAEKDSPQKIYNPYYYEWVNWNLVKDLIEEGKFDVNSKANDGNTILHEAASSGKLDVVKYLVDEKKADVNTRANDGRTPLHHAAFSGSLDLVKYLVDEKGVDVNAKDNYGRTPLYHAASSGNLNLVKYLVEEKRVDVNTKDNYSNTLLHEAASSNNLDLVKYLIERGADVNAKTNGNWTSLHKAAEKDNEEIVLALLDEGADINAKTNGGWTALHWAAYKGNTETVLALLNNGANVNAKIDSGETPLDIAEQHGKGEIVGLLRSNSSETHGIRHTHQRSSRAIKEVPIITTNDNLEFFVAQNNATPVMVEEKATSSATRTSSLINDLFSWVKSSIGELFHSRAALPENNTTQSSISQVDAQVNVDGTIMLLDLVIRKVTGQKHVATENQSISLLEAQGYASSITLGFDTLLKRTARSCGIQDTNFNPIPVQSTIVGHIRNGKFSEISKILYSSAEKACPDYKQTDKFLARLKGNLKDFLAEKEAVFKGDVSSSKVPERAPAARLSKENGPSTILNGTSIAKGLSYAERVKAESLGSKSGVRIG